MTTATQAAFARQTGFSRARITQLKKAGRLVMDAAGKRVDVEASLSRMAATADPGRHDVVERHSDARAASGKPAAPQLTDAGLGLDDSGRAKAKALLMHYENSLLKIDMALRRGLRYELAAVRKEAGGIGALIRSGIERVIDKTAPRLAACTNDLQRRAILAEEIHRLRWIVKREIPRALRRMKDAAGQNKSGESA